MPPSVLPSVAPSGISPDRDERIRHLPAAAREAFARFHTTGDLASLDRVIFAVLEDFIPRKPTAALASLPGHTRLIDDLGFDSLAITEVVIFNEDLFGITIANQEIILVRTLDDLRDFVRTKLAVGAAR